LKYLGVTVSSNLCWSASIHNTCAKARKQLGLLYQHFYCSAPAGLLCLCVGPPSHYLYQLTQGYTAKLATGLWFSGCQDPIQIMNWPPLACCMPKKAKAAAVQPYSVQWWFNHTTLSIHSSPPPFFHASSVYGIVSSYHKNICPSSLLPKCYHTLWNKLSSDLISAHSQAMLRHHLNQVVLKLFLLCQLFLLHVL